MQKARGKSTARSRSAVKKQPKQEQQSSDEEVEEIKVSQARGGQKESRPTRSQIATQSQIVFPKGTTVAFIDPSQLNEYRLGILLRDYKEEEEEALMDVFTEIAPLKFQKNGAKQPVLQYTIICDVNATAQKVARNAKAELAINKQQHNKISKLMDNVVAAIENERLDNEDENFDNDSASKSESESVEEESKHSERGRSPVKGKKRPSVAQSQSQKSKKSPVMAQKKSASAARGKSTGRKAPAKKSDVEMKSDGEEESKEIINTATSKKRAASKKHIKPDDIPVVGQKRLHPSQRSRSKKGKKGEDGEEEVADESHVAEDEGSEELSQPVKKRKLGAGKEKVVPQKKAPKMPTVYKKGKWNPDIEPVDEDKYKFGPSSDLYIECCVRCNNKNLQRAANLRDAKLLQKGIDANKKISMVTAFWSPELKYTPLELLIWRNDHNLIELLLHPKLKVPAHSTYEQEREKFFNDRVGNPQYLMNFVDSGMVSNMAYGARVRKVQMTRGNRQGNNAFLEYQDNNHRNPVNQLHDAYLVKKMCYMQSVEWETYKQLIKLYASFENVFQNQVFELVRAGNRKIAYEFIKTMVKYPNFGFNQLHQDVLSTDAELEKVLRQSVTKKANTNKDITPLHCACINPNPKYLKALLDVNPELNIIDQDLRKPIHYAAACEGPEPFQLLINAGASLPDQDNQKRNCLHIAAMTGRAHNVRLILQNSPQLLNTKDKSGMTSFAYACKFGHTEVVKVLLEFKARINSGYGLARMTPLCWAAAYGHYDLSLFLLDNKARVLGKDKFQRTPLIMAVRNGNAKIASLLLQRGAEWNHQDSSKNTPLHYAAAYGWLDCIELLLKAGADVNAQNSWKISPINIAMLKSHQGCVKRLLEEPNVDVNGKDEKGRTLIMLSMFVLDDDSVEFVSFLLRKGADPNIGDLEGQTALHYIAKFQPQRAWTNGKWDMAPYYKQLEIQKRITQTLIQNGADLTIKDSQKRTPFTICLENDNAPLLEYLQDRVSINKEPELLFAFKNKIFNEAYQKILTKLIQNDPPTRETINMLDDNGYTPFLAYVKAYSDNYYAMFYNTIYAKVNYQVSVHGSNWNNYRLTNADLFDKFGDNQNPHQYNYDPNVTEDKKKEVVTKFIEQIITQPFIRMLKFLLDNGADSQATVGKLKKYRDLELLRSKQLAGLAEGQEIPVEKEEKVLKREEKLKEMDRRGRGKMPKKSVYNRNGYVQPMAAAQQPSEVNDKYELIGGKKVLREFGGEGKRNALHLIVLSAVPSLTNFLLKLGINPDLPDYDEVTPFNLLSSTYEGVHQELFKSYFDQLLSLNIRIDYPNRLGRTAFLNFYDKQRYDLAYQMLDLGANINQMDNSGLFALKYALIRRQNLLIEELLKRGANINQIDNKGRNLLHHAINMSSATADATFETEQFLIERGVEINLKDNKDRVPLHYAFVKISNWKDNSQIDPIETVSSICGYKGLLLDVPDKWQKTPLHYASQRGASICAMYMIQRGAEMERTDIYGNTPLGVALINKHYNYGIILIQKLAQVTHAVHYEDAERIKKMWEEEEKQQRALYRSKSKGGVADAEMIVESSEKKPVKKHRDLFKKRNQMMVDDYYDDYGGEEEDEDYDDEDAYQENVFNTQNAFGVQVYKAARKQPANQWGMGAFGNPWGAQPAAPQHHNQVGGELISKDDKEGVSMFKLAIRGGQQGLAYLMLDNGYDLTLAMQDAMDEKKFMLVLTLLNKNPNDEQVQQKNKKGQNLFHILSQNAGGCSKEHLLRIYETLKKRGVDVKSKDNFGRTALHYAVISGSLDLVKLLLEAGNEYKVNEVDNDGFIPLSYFLKGKNAEAQFYNHTFQIDNIFLSLVTSGADVNFIYPEEDFKPALKDEEVEDLGAYDPLGKYHTTALISTIRRQPPNEILRNNIIGLIEFGAKLDVVDSDGRDAIMHAIINNNEMVVKILLENKKQLKVNQKGQDKAGRTAAHYVVNPLRYGSFENVEILRLLHRFGFNLNIKDAQGKTPAQYAAEQESGVMLKEIAQLVGQMQALENYNRKLSMIESHKWSESKVDFEADAETYMEMAQEKEALRAKDDEHRVPVDETGKFEKSYKVYYDEQEKPWDVYLTKVDLKNGVYGDYVFYKMQLLHDSNRDLYVVFTRWGRIGETGMNQRTPFNDLEEARQDYRKIFKQKTGGNNFEELDQFSRVKKKYNLTRVNYITVDFKDYLQPFDYEKCPKSKLSKPLFDLYEEIANVTMYQRAMNNFGLDTNVMPFSGVRKQSLVEARTILMEISEALKEDQTLAKEGIKADFEALVKVKERISELSSRFYELIPQARYKNQIAPPINNQHFLKNQYDIIDGLSNIEFASKMLLAAVFRQNEMNPVDYVYHALNIQIEHLEEDNPEFEVIKKYIDNTRNVDQNGWNSINSGDVEISVFRIQRKGEAEMIQAFKEVANHYLLFHGSAMFNYLGILAQGLRIAPPEAPVTGYMFGKGVYFADMFDKSYSYAARGYQQQDSYLMLLSEVVLGKSKEVYNAEYIEKLDSHYHSVKGCGRRGPGYKHTVTCPNGVKIPLGKVINYHEKDPEMLKQLMLQHNEYIVYNTNQIRMRYIIQIKKKVEKAKK